MGVYFDHNATTPLDPRVLEAMLPYLQGAHGNPSSVHRYGRAARDAIEQARAQVAALCGGKPAELIWTSGGTEADNLALKGSVLPGQRVLYGATEHPAVLEAAQALTGCIVEPISVDRHGQVDWDRFEAQLTRSPAPALVSLMLANNETGVIQDIARVTERLSPLRALLHVDAVQTAGKLALDFHAVGADLLTISAHKIGGPKGIGALLRSAQVDLRPLLHGGSQERGLRGGTENLPAIVGFGKAAELALDELASRTAQSRTLRDRLEAGLLARGDAFIFAQDAPRLANTVQFAIRGFHGEALLMRLDRLGFAVSSGSACSSGKGEPSHVLLAMGYPPELAYGAVRVSFGAGNTPEQVDAFLAALAQIQPASGAGTEVFAG